MRRRYWLFLSSIFLALVIGFGLGEWFVRETVPYWNLDMALKYESTIFSKHVIKRESRTVHRRQNPSDTISINQYGYRGESVQRKKPDDQVRIMFYGGSQVFSASTGDNSWPERIESILNENSQKDYEVINAGTPGHASFDSLGRLLSYGHYFEPDHLVLNNSWNDIKYFHLNKHPLTRVKPYSEAENPRRNYLNFLDRVLGQYSQFYTLLRTKYFTWTFDPKRRGDFFVPDRKNRLSEEALKQYRLNVRTFVDISQTVDANPILMKQPRLVTEDVKDSAQQKVRYSVQSLKPQVVHDAYRRINTILEDIAKETDAMIYEPKTINGKEAYFYDHVHLTPKGANILAEKFSGFFLGKFTNAQ